MNQNSEAGVRGKEDQGNSKLGERLLHLRLDINLFLKENPPCPQLRVNNVGGRVESGEQRGVECLAS